MSRNSLEFIADICSKIDRPLRLTPERAHELFYDPEQLDRQVELLLGNRTQLGICSLLAKISHNPDASQRQNVWRSALREAVRTQCSLFMQEQPPVAVPQPRVGEFALVSV